MSEDVFDQIIEAAISRWRAKGFSEVLIQNLIRQKGQYREPFKAKYRGANKDEVFRRRTEVDDINDRIQTGRSLKEVWDE